MHLRLVVAIGCLSTALPLTSVSGQTEPSQPLDWSFSIGVEPQRLDLFGQEPGVDARLVANLTRSWQAANSRFARHVSLLVGSDFPYGRVPDPNDGCGPCNYTITGRYAGLTVGASYDVFRVSRFTPYLTTGTGVYFTKMSRNLNEIEARSVDSRYFRTGFSLGANAGLGLKARFGSREFFVEQMFHAIDLARLSKGVYPLNFGVRF